MKSSITLSQAIGSFSLVLFTLTGRDCRMCQAGIFPSPDREISGIKFRTICMQSLLSTTVF